MTKFFIYLQLHQNSTILGGERKIWFRPTWYIAFTRHGVTNCVVRYTHVRPQVSDRSIDKHVTFSISCFCALFQRIVIVLQRPGEVRLLRIGDSRADHVIPAIDSFFLYVTFRFNCMENMGPPLKASEAPSKKTELRL